MENFVSTLVWAAIIQGFLLGVLYLFSKSYSSFANRLLGLFLFALIIEALSIFLPWNSIGGYPLGVYFAFPEVKLFFPTLFLHFILVKVGRNRKFNLILRGLYILAFSFLSLTLVSIVVFLFTGNDLSYYWSDNLLVNLFMGQQILAFFLTIVSFVIAIKQTKDYQKQLQFGHSDLELHNLTWLWQFIYCMVPIAILWGIEIIRVLMGGVGDSPIVFMTWFFLAIFIYFVSYKAFRYQSLFEKKGSAPIQRTWEAQLPNSNQSGLEETCQQLQIKMEVEKFYLQPDLNIYDLSRALNIPSRTISTCINQKFDQNFSEWVNSYRVKVAMALLQDPEFNHLSIEGIGTDAGFNSRSAMYAAFRKTTGSPPGNFRTTQVS